MSTDSQPVKKRRRTELACTTCRHKKRRCDGFRPQCGACRERAHDCVYEPLPDDERAIPASSLTTLRHERRYEELCQQAGGSLLTSDAPASQPQSQRQAPSSASHTQTVDVDEDGLVDVLATATFNENADTGVDYFGPSSNHSMFRSLSVVLVEMSRLSGTGALLNRDPPPAAVVDTERQNDRVPVHADQQQPQHRGDTMQGSGCRYLLPRQQQLILLVNHYVATVGVVLPFVDKSTIISEYHVAARQSPPRFRRGFLSLISIMCALALSTLDDDDAETYYHQSLAALDLESSRGWSVETVQALLLIITYQQNNQRSVTSWTTHSLAVKAALQQGLHSPTVRNRQNRKTADLTERLWIGIVFNDLMIGMSLGRPGLVHPRLLQCLQLPDLEPVRSAGQLSLVETLAGQAFFIAMASSSTLLSTAIEVMYNYNVEGLEKEDFRDLIHKYNRLAGLTQAWCKSISPFGGLVSAAELQGVIDGSYEPLRLRILLSIHYYRISLVIAWPIIASFLRMITESPIETHSDQFLSWTHFTIVARAAWLATRELGGIIQALVMSSESFLRSNAAWFTCNYALCLHNFALLLVCGYSNGSQLDIPMPDIRAALLKNLDNMKPLERSSLMTYKSRRSLMKLLEAFDILGELSSSRATCQVLA
ncbi:hypothetical protein BKA64DRAFT_756773 [Cadophora sp. MPI-SDFR-AT-0126]|nr:hypothetical protein BKA64DRAFT_756773 [Leotiomycetes sp. MPI-SDFR-AT-0126]